MAPISIQRSFRYGLGDLFEYDDDFYKKDLGIRQRHRYFGIL